MWSVSSGEITLYIDSDWGELPRLGGIEEDQDLLAACVFDVIEAVDQEGDGEISKEEFVTNAMNCKFIFNMLKSKRT